MYAAQKEDFRGVETEARVWIVVGNIATGAAYALNNDYLNGQHLICYAAMLGSAVMAFRLLQQLRVAAEKASQIPPR